MANLCFLKVHDVELERKITLVFIIIYKTRNDYDRDTARYSTIENGKRKCK